MERLPLQQGLLLQVEVLHDAGSAVPEVEVPRGRRLKLRRISTQRIDKLLKLRTGRRRHRRRIVALVSKRRELLRAHLRQIHSHHVASVEVIADARRRQPRALLRERVAERSVSDEAVAPAARITKKTNQCTHHEIAQHDRKAQTNQLQEELMN